MRTNTNIKKAQQLGMSSGTAAGQLRKLIMFQLIRETGKDICFQCGNKIDSIDELSIEHKMPWLDSNDPKGLFFDLNNIAFSHMKCNYASRRTHSIRGSSTINAVLSEKDVYEIKYLLKYKIFTITKIAELYGVSRGTVHSISCAKSWKHINI